MGWRACSSPGPPILGFSRQTSFSSSQRTEHVSRVNADRGLDSYLSWAKILLNCPFPSRSSGIQQLPLIGFYVLCQPWKILILRVGSGFLRLSRTPLEKSLQLLHGVITRGQQSAMTMQKLGDGLGSWKTGFKAENMRIRINAEF